MNNQKEKEQNKNRHSKPFDCRSRQTKVKLYLKMNRLPRFLQNLAMTKPNCQSETVEDFVYKLNCHPQLE